MHTHPVLRVVKITPQQRRQADAMATHFDRGQLQRLSRRDNVWLGVLLGLAAAVITAMLMEATP